MSDEVPSAHQEAYLALSRRYRPRKFADIVGQAHVVRILSNAIVSGQVAHTFILTGVRGVGKTTIARIIARALNCIGVDGQGQATVSPCGVCKNCKDILADRHMDVMEMDAASRTGVDDIREIIDSVHYRPVLGRYKVYIIDEVHMLSKNAFNALLKTLEEPPEHVKFIFATTEIQRIPITVLSRCQRFDLRRVEADLLEKHLRFICEQEKVDISDEGVKIIVRASEGSVRDSLSMLDQVIAFSGGLTIEAYHVRNTLGLADRSRVETLFVLVMAGQIAEALEEFLDQCTSGADPIIILSELLEYSHLLTRMHVAPQAMKNVSDDFDLPSAARIAQELNVPSLTCAWQILLKGIEDVRKAPRPVNAAEMVLIRLAYASTLPSPAEIVRKVHNMEGGGTQEQTSYSAGKAPRSSFDVIPPPSGLPRDSAPNQPTAVDVNHTGQNLTLMSFEDVILLAEQKKELRLAFSLKDSVRLVAFDGLERRIEIGLVEKGAQSIVHNLRVMLDESTGQTWTVVASDQLGGATKYQQEAAAKEALREKVMNHALVVDIFKKFPDAQLDFVQEASDHSKTSWETRHAEDEAFAYESINFEDDNSEFLMNQ